METCRRSLTMSAMEGTSLYKEEYNLQLITKNYNYANKHRFY